MFAYKLKLIRGDGRTRKSYFSNGYVFRITFMLPFLMHWKGESQDGIAEQEGQFIVPVPPNPDFTGREKELVMIDEYLNPQYDNPDSTCPTVAVHGLGGVGWVSLIIELKFLDS